MGFTGAALVGASLYASNRANKQAKSAASSTARANLVTQEVNATQQAQERRQKVREERVRRAQLLASADASGASGSSGALGALSALSTEFAGNLGVNNSLIQKSNEISIFSQAAADSMSSAQQWQHWGQQANQLAGLSLSIQSSYNAGMAKKQN